MNSIYYPMRKRLRLEGHDYSFYGAYFLTLCTSDRRCILGRIPVVARQSISTRVQTFKTLVTKEIGYPIFQRSFYDHIIRNPKDYENACTYIFLNPVNWANDELYQKEIF